MKQFAHCSKRRKQYILAFELDGKRQDILIEAVPGLRLMAVLIDVNLTKFAKLEALQEAARAHGIEFSIHRVARGEEIDAAIDSAQASGATALNILSSPLFYPHRHLIARAVAAHLPTIYDLPETAGEGGFAACQPGTQDHRHPGRTTTPRLIMAGSGMVGAQPWQPRDRQPPPDLSLGPGVRWDCVPIIAR
jgi:hypothetical protein